MDTAIKIVELMNLATPGIAQLILMIKNKNGTVSVVAMLDEADSQFDATLARGKEWLASKG